MSSIQEIEADLKELKGLKAQATRLNNQSFLNSKIIELESKLANNVIETTPSMPTTSRVVIDHTTPVSSIRLTNYAMDQSDKFVKLYIPLKGVSSLPAASIATHFSARECDVTVYSLNNVNYTFSMKGLLHDIDPDLSQVKQKTDDLLIMLRKKESIKWDSLTKVEQTEKEKHKPKLDESADPQGSLMNMMKEMYDTGDDEMKRSIKKAWFEGQNKKMEM